MLVSRVFSNFQKVAVLASIRRVVSGALRLSNLNAYLPLIASNSNVPSDLVVIWISCLSCHVRIGVPGLPNIADHSREHSRRIGAIVSAISDGDMEVSTSVNSKIGVALFFFIYPAVRGEGNFGKVLIFKQELSQVGMH